MASPTLIHQRMARRVANAIEGVLPPGLQVDPGWAWRPASDEFIRDVQVFAGTDQQARLTDVPVLAVEVVSSEPYRNVIRKFREYAAAGRPRYRVVDPDGPEIVAYELTDGLVFVECGRAANGDAGVFDVGPVPVMLTPSDLVR